MWLTKHTVMADFNDIIGPGDDAFDGEAVILRVPDDHDFALPRRAR